MELKSLTPLAEFVDMLMTRATIAFKDVPGSWHIRLDQHSVVLSHRNTLINSYNWAASYVLEMARTDAEWMQTEIELRLRRLLDKIKEDDNAS